LQRLENIKATAYVTVFGPTNYICSEPLEHTWLTPAASAAGRRRAAPVPALRTQE